jgi:ubiquinone/menaquinone biosynthesis C-methylase UbiE
MRLSRIEFLAMNNPLRRFIQKHLEFRIFKQLLKKHNINLTGKIILDAGCGSGYSTELLIKEFTPSKIIAFDFMQEQINLAKKRGLKADFFVGDITKIDLPSNAFDAAFIFGVLHHVAEWKEALREIGRVLKPGSVVLMEEPNKTGLGHFGHLGFVHPEEAMFSWSEFENEIEHGGFKILGKRKVLTDKFKSFLCQKHRVNSG